MLQCDDGSDAYRGRASGEQRRRLSAHRVAHAHEVRLLRGGVAAPSSPQTQVETWNTAVHIHLEKCVSMWALLGIFN